MFIEWIKQLTPEFYIVIGFLILLFILIIVQIIRLSLVARRLGTQDFRLMDTIHTDKEGKDHFQFVISNLAFTSNNLNAMGFILHKDIIHELVAPNRLIPPRNKHVENFTMEDIEALTIDGVKKFKKIKLYAENDLGEKRESKGRALNRYLKKKFKANRKALRKALKEERFETGNYNFWERVGLVLKLFGRPFYKLNLKIKRKTNNALRESEVRRKQKSKHDLIEIELTQTTAEARNIQIIEESMIENKTRETELELLKQKKILEIERLKKEEYEKQFEARKDEIISIDVLEEVEKYFEENPINYREIDEQVLKDVLEKIKQQQKDLQEEAKRPKKQKPKKEEPKVEEEKKDDKPPKKEQEPKEEKPKPEPKDEKPKQKPKSNKGKPQDKPKNQQSKPKNQKPKNQPNKKK